MSDYEEHVNAMWEEVEGRKPEPVHRPTDEEKWKAFVEKYNRRNFIVLSEFGTIDMSENAMKDVQHGENMTYEEYLQAMFDSRNSRRTCFEHCYYDNAWCQFKGQISRINKKRGTVLFKRIYINAEGCDGICFDGKEDHVWMDIEPFEQFNVGTCLEFDGEIYRYLKTGNGKQISMGIREPYNISEIPFYQLPSDDDMLMQAVDRLVCECCMYNELCNMRMCIANDEWRKHMRNYFWNAIKNKE